MFKLYFLTNLILNVQLDKAYKKNYFELELIINSYFLNEDNKEIREKN